MLQIGRFNELKVEKEVDFGIYLQSEEGEILMPSKYIPEGTKPGDFINAFIYKDSEDRLIATTLVPAAQVGEFAALRVKDVNQTGAFLDWGLEKDLLVPHSEQHKRMKPGEIHIVKVVLDPKTNRIIAVSRLGGFFSKDLSGFSPGMEVDLMIYEFTDLGIMAIVNNQYRGMLYRNEVFKELRIGDRMKGYIKKVRDDGKLDLTLKKFGYREVENTRDIVLNKLKENNGSLPYSDHSSPEEIKRVFQMSKKIFKKTIGGLYKAGLIEIREDGISLK